MGVNDKIPKMDRMQTETLTNPRDVFSLLFSDGAILATHFIIITYMDTLHNVINVVI